MRKFIFVLSISVFSLSLTSCHTQASQFEGKISSINIIDHNGMSETISSKERLNAFEKTDFFSPQPYQKVLRLFAREKNGDIRSCITSYHPNGGIKQYLEAVNNRAFGSYREWHPNGQIKVNATVIGGVADINTQAEESWIFNGINRAWDEDGNLLADISYSKGSLEGESRYYHPRDVLWKSIPFSKNVIHGTQKIYLEDGRLFSTTEYKNGNKEGSSKRFWPSSQVAFEEIYRKGCLMEGNYFDLNGEPTSEIKNGNGYRTVFGKSSLQRLEEYRNGIKEGQVKAFDEKNQLVCTFYVKDGEKHGEEIHYYPSFTDAQKKKILLTWDHGILNGKVKTWYENGNSESQREMSQNKKNEILTAWYKNGALMLAEEYDNDQLIKGEYFRPGEKNPISKIENGNGIATIFNSDGNFVFKITYQDGKPIE